MGTDLAEPVPRVVAGGRFSLPERFRLASGGERGPVAVLAGWIGAVWILAFLLPLVHLDIVLVPLVVLAFASVLRTGAALVDRLVVAVLVTAAAVLVLGLLTSLTPIGIATAPQAALLISGALAAGWAAGRRPRIPVRPRPGDAWLVALGAYAFWQIHKPVAGKAPGVAIRYSLPVEDRITNFALYDDILRTGKYGFYHNDNPAYPQGMHYLFAWFDHFVRSVSRPADQLAAFFRFFLYVQGVYALLVVALVWAARWVVEPYLRGWRSAVVQAVVGVLALLAPFPMMLSVAFDAELFGLVVLAVATALLVRPAHHWIEHLILGAAVTITIAFAYTTFVVFVAGAFVVTTYVYRAHFRGRLLHLGVGYAVVLGIAAFPSVYAMLTAGMNYVRQAKVVNGSSVATDDSLLVALALLSLTALASPVGRRIPRAWTAAGTTVGSALVVTVFGLAQRSNLHKSYYFSKFVTALFVIALVTAPMAAFLCVRGWRGRFGVRTLVIGVGAPLLAAVTVLGGFSWNIPNSGPHSSVGDSPLKQWSDGDFTNVYTVPVVELYQHHPTGFGPGPVVVLAENAGYANFRRTRFYMTLIGRNDEGVTAGNAVILAKIGGPVVDGPAFDAGIADLEAYVRESPRPPVFLIGDQATADRVRARLAADGLTATAIWYRFQ